MKSPLSFSYQDMIREEEYQLANMEKSLPAAVQSGRMPDTIATRKIAMKKRLIRMLKKQVKYVQLSLGECFDQTK